MNEIVYSTDTNQHLNSFITYEQGPIKESNRWVIQYNQPHLKHVQNQARNQTFLEGVLNLT